MIGQTWHCPVKTAKLVFVSSLMLLFFVTTAVRPASIHRHYGHTPLPVSVVAREAVVQAARGGVLCVLSLLICVCDKAIRVAETAVTGTTLVFSPCVPFWRHRVLPKILAAVAALDACLFVVWAWAWHSALCSASALTVPHQWERQTEYGTQIVSMIVSPVSVLMAALSIPCLTVALLTSKGLRVVVRDTCQGSGPASCISDCMEEKKGDAPG